MPITFHSEVPGFKVKNQTALKDWIKRTIASERLSSGDLSFIFCSDDYLHKINLQYLNHDTLTDIITFPHDPAQTKVVSGDIFISTERVRENADKFKVDFENELRRVIIHGVLHLCGFKDKSPSEKKKMREMEDKYLSRYE